MKTLIVPMQDGEGDSRYLLLIPLDPAACLDVLQAGKVASAATESLRAGTVIEVVLTFTLDTARAKASTYDRLMAEGITFQDGFVVDEGEVVDMPPAVYDALRNVPDDVYLKSMDAHIYAHAVIVQEDFVSGYPLILTDFARGLR